MITEQKKDVCWHDIMTEPISYEGYYLLKVHNHYEDYPEDDYDKYIVALYYNKGWCDEGFDSEADSTILQWAFISKEK